MWFSPCLNMRKCLIFCNLSSLPQAISTLSCSIKAFGQWQVNRSESELSYYRFIASVMDLLLSGTPITMVDGEHASHPTKKNAQLNKSFFEECDETRATYGRKIDLILAAGDERLELCSNV
ncbi:hypothetical protein DM01DRAFT_1395562 [Hesseltinella vesiculosa]|uniref:Uncharacterized protein n=1 Tax=Hesseltinella vesiculosa TaxID=101127 RepID=A0A1X2GUY7_9FUNG|nr:hypothetical protein DM01DRAFT_1395562 [Hesseltinella vesiculosa]